MGKVNLRELDLPRPWTAHGIAQIGGTALRVARLEGEYHWHTHPHEDEFFLVVRGTVFIDTEFETVELHEWEGYKVDAGTLHRSRTPTEAIVLLIEPVQTKTTGVPTDFG
jgi:mannose-6-phosphate isomerase-like protein (cupin superfamily)